MGHSTFLVIENDPSTRYVLVERLQSLFPDDRILVAESGEAGLELARRSRLDLIVLDLHLHDMDGFEFAEALRRTGSAASIVVLTGDVRPEVRRRAEAAGVAAFLEKPDGLDQLPAIARRLLDARRRPDA